MVEGEVAYVAEIAYDIHNERVKLINEYKRNDSKVDTSLFGSQISKDLVYRYRCFCLR